MKLEEKMLWTTCREMVEIERKQCLEEGRCCEGSPADEAAGAFLRRTAGTDPDRRSDAFLKTEEEARALLLSMEKAPIRPEYPYKEPDGPSGIEALLMRRAAEAFPAGTEASHEAGTEAGHEAAGRDGLTEAYLREHLLGAVAGRVAACTLGMPVEGWMRDRISGYLRASGAWPLSGYIRSDASGAVRDQYGVRDDDDFRPYGREKVCWLNNLKVADAPAGIREEAERCRAAQGWLPEYYFPVDDDINYMVLALKTVEKHGRSFAPEDYAEELLYGAPPFHACTAERVAIRNLMNGLMPPECASYCNPYREWIGAQIRTDFYGYINPGDPVSAAAMALRDAAVTHTKNGVYAAMYVSALISLSYLPELTMEERVTRALALLPEESRFAAEMNRLLTLWRAPESGESASPAERRSERYLTLENDIHARYDEADSHDWCLAIPNALIVTAAVLTHDGFEEAVEDVVLSGFDTDCNAATVGSVMGMAGGISSIPGKWLKDFLPVMHTSVYGYESLSFEEYAERAMKCMKH